MQVEETINLDQLPHLQIENQSDFICIVEICNGQPKTIAASSLSKFKEPVVLDKCITNKYFGFGIKKDDPELRFHGHLKGSDCTIYLIGEGCK